MHSIYCTETIARELMRIATPEQRKTLMLNCPAAYNEYVGREVVTVIYSDDRGPVEK